MQLSLCLSFHLRRSLGGYTMGTTMGFWVEIVEALAPQTSPPNPVEVPTVAYEHLFRLQFRGHFFITRSNGRHRGYYQGKIPEYHETPITARGYGYDRLHPVAKRLGSHTPHTV
jgi:hypothetical protein